MAAVTRSGHWERGEVSAVNRGGRAWHSGERLGSGSQSQWRQSIGSEVAAVTHSPDSQ